MHLCDEENAVLKGPQKRRSQKLWGSFQYIESTTNVFIIERQQLGKVYPLLP